MPETRKLKVFLCHASQDKPIVRELYQRLAAEGWIDPWLDEEKLLPGMNWDMEIKKAVEAADAVIVCLSNGSVTKEGYIQRELRFVLDIALTKPEETIFIIPLRLEECQPPRRLRGWQYADYFPKEHQDRAYVRLSKSLQLRAEALGFSPIKSTPKSVVPPAIVSVEVEKPAFSERAHKYAYPSNSLAHLDKQDPPPDRLTLNGIEFCRIPAGKFLMGSPVGNKSVDDVEKPQNSLNIPYDYWMARFPVTNAQYAGLYPFGKQRLVKDWRGTKNHPVINVSWSDARAYCQVLNDMLKGQLPQNYVLCLPSEAEWEKAARGADGYVYPWGNRFDQTKCNSSEGSKGGTTLVGIYSPQGDLPYGCADMSGNVWEWTRSLFKPYPYNPKDGREVENVEGGRVLRGGSYCFNATLARCAFRIGYETNDLFSDSTGFRFVLTPIRS